MKNWIDPQEVVVPPDLLAAVEGDALLARTLVRRGMDNAASARRFLFPDLYIPASPYDLPDMARAVERVKHAIAQGDMICVWGDFDVDGQTATALLVSALRGLGGTVIYYIPDRLTEGHGVSIPRLGSLLDQGVQLVITCDTGIAAHEAIGYASSRGVEVIVTDHHQLPPTLPDAHSVVNPQRLAASHPLHTLPGVGCAYKLVEALYDGAGRSDELPPLLDLVALGIVADVAVQTGDTRYLLQRGLDVLRGTQRSGLRAMADLAGIAMESVNEETIGFSIAPRLNALGRLDDANLAVEFLTTDDRERARILASQLEGLNAQRKMLSDQVFQAAQAQISNDRKLLDQAVLVLAHERWPGGIIGIVANRLVEVYNRPVILLNVTPGQSARGSARSVPGVDITAAIAAHADLLSHFGGHTMAAGLSLHPDTIPEFRRAISRTVEAAPVDRTPSLTIDAYLSLGEISLELLARLGQLAPFGPGNPALTFATRKLTLKSHRQLGRSGDHVRLTVGDDEDTVQDVVWWHADLDSLPLGRFDLAYALRANDYQGQHEVQLEFIDARAVDEPPQEFAHRREVAVVDCRDLLPGDQLNTLQSSGDELLVWNEGGPIPGVASVRRDQLRLAPALAIWTIPPGAAELRIALETVNPNKVYLFAVEAGDDSMKAFAQRLAGLVKHVISTKAGATTLGEVAGAMNHRETTVRAALAWMEARGDINVIHDGGSLRIMQGGDPQGDRTKTAASLESLLRETAAYRAYFRRAEANTLLRI